MVRSFAASPWTTPGPVTGNAGIDGSRSAAGPLPAVLGVVPQFPFDQARPGIYSICQHRLGGFPFAVCDAARIDSLLCYPDLGARDVCAEAIDWDRPSPRLHFRP